MAITQAVCNSFKVELLQGEHDFRASGGDAFKLALYTNSASLDATTTAYITGNEVSASGTYAAGGGALTNSGASGSGATAFIDFADLSFTSATIFKHFCNNQYKCSSYGSRFWCSKNFNIRYIYNSVPNSRRI
jgi:hypothetical protein